MSSPYRSFKFASVALCLSAASACAAHRVAPLLDESYFLEELAPAPLIIASDARHAPHVTSAVFAPSRQARRVLASRAGIPLDQSKHSLPRRNCRPR